MGRSITHRPMLQFFDFVKQRKATGIDGKTSDTSPGAATAVQNTVVVPEVDTSDTIGSLAGILGPTPEERAAQEQRLQQHRQKMHGWTALFNGLRHLSNLYFTAKGAAPQKYSDPHQQIEQQYQDEKKRLDDMSAATQKYYAGLWGLQRQVSDEKRRNLLADAQAKYYGTRDEVARQKSEIDQQKAELERLKAVRVIKQKDGSLMKFDPVSGTIEPLTEADPLYQELIRSQINRNNRSGTGRTANNGTYGYRTTKHVDPATGDVITERVPTTGGEPQTTVTHPKKNQKPAGGQQQRQGGGSQQQRQGGGSTTQQPQKKKKHVGW